MSIYTDINALLDVNQGVLTGHDTSHNVIHRGLQDYVTQLNTINVELTARVASWAPTTLYNVGTLVVNPNGDIVNATSSHTSGASYDPTKWALSPAHPFFFIPNLSYASGYRVINPAGAVVSAKINFTSGATYNPNDWTEDPRFVNPRPPVVNDHGNWTPATVYAYGDVVTSNYQRWLTLAAHTSGTTFSGVTNWVQLSLPVINTLASSTVSAGYTLMLTDATTAVESTSASAITITVPSNASVAFPLGTIIEVLQYGAGQVTLVGAAGVTLRTASTLKTRAQFSTASIRQRAANEWVVSGDVA